jgi:hypothetical protein
MTPKNNELRMQVGLVITHTDDELLFVRSEKNPNILDALQAFADLVRADEREWVGLTDDEVDLILWQGVFDAKDIRAIEAKLKEKNGAL